MNKKDESTKRVSLQIMVYPHVKEIIEQIARESKPRTSVSSIGEMVLTEYAGKHAKATNGKSPKKRGKV